MSSEKWKLGLEKGTSVVTYEEEISFSLWFCLHSVGPQWAGRMLSSLCPFRQVGELFKIWEMVGEKEKVNPG